MRPIELSERDTPNYRPDLKFEAFPENHFMMWPLEVEENGEVGFFCLIPESWDKLRERGVGVGTEFQVVEGRTLVATGTITRLFETNQ